MNYKDADQISQLRIAGLSVSLFAVHMHKISGSVHATNQVIITLYEWFSLKEALILSELESHNLACIRGIIKDI